MYISELCDSLTVREIDGSESELSLHPGPNKEFFHYICYARICSDDRIVVQDESGNLIKYSSDGEFIWRIESETSRTVSFCLDSSDLLYCATSNKVKVYLPTGAFSHVLVSDLKHPRGIAIDGDSNVHVSFSSSIQVFNSERKLICEYTMMSWVRWRASPLAQTAHS